MKFGKVLFGVGLGVLAGLLFAPKKGSELREDIKAKSKSTYDYLTSLTREDVEAKLGETIENIKKSVDEFDPDDFKETTKEKVDEVQKKLEILAWLIVKLGEVVNSTGLAIILITIGIRILLFPVTQKTAMQSENMKKAQPELARLEKKYENKQDQESMMKKSQEMMAIYKKYNISPMAGCIFALLQIPLLFAFLEAINRIPAIFEENFLGIFQMGTTPLVALRNGDWYYLILLVLIVATTFTSFKMNKSVANPELEKQTKGMMYFMIIFIGIMGFSLSSAIAIYWITSSVFTILQNVYTDIIKKRANN